MPNKLWPSIQIGQSKIFDISREVRYRQQYDQKIAQNLNAFLALVPRIRVGQILAKKSSQELHQSDNKNYPDKIFDYGRRGWMFYHPLFDKFY